MNIEENLSSEPVVILGSKPEADLPEIGAPFVLAANGAVEMGVKYREKYNSRIIGMVASIELKEREHVQQSLIKSQPDEIVVLGGDVEDPDSFIKNSALALFLLDFLIIPFFT